MCRRLTAARVDKANWSETVASVSVFTLRLTCSYFWYVLRTLLIIETNIL